MKFIDLLWICLELRCPLSGLRSNQRIDVIEVMHPYHAGLHSTYSLKIVTVWKLEDTGDFVLQITKHVWKVVVYFII